MSWNVVPDYYEGLKVVYEDHVPVRLRSVDKSERVENIQIRMSLGKSKEGRGVQVLVIQISSEADLYFLHALEVNEDDFQHLKVDQGILVDFSAFPEKLTELLKLCIESHGQETPKFVADLLMRGTETRFSVIETNQFKHITHISLGFRPGSDAAIKQYLASRLNESRGLSSRLEQSLRRTEEDLARTREAAAATSSELSTERDSYGRERTQWQAELAARLADAKEAHLRELGETRAKLVQERGEMEDKLRGQLGEAERRAAAAEGERKDLQQQKYALDARVSELSAKLGAAEGERRALKEEVERLGKEAGETARGRHEAERALGELRIDAAGLRQQVAAKEELAGALKKRLADAEAAQASLGETLGEVRRANQSLEARLAAAAGEVDKGNQIIDRLQAELKAARAKMKLKAAVIAQQEAVLTERQGELERVTREALHLRQALEREEHARGVAEARAEDQRRKLEEAQSLLESNQQMIQWLNAQVTEAQLGRYAPSSSRYSFRSSVTLPGGRGGAAGAGGAVAPGSIAQKYVEAANMPRGVTAGDRGPGEGPLGRPQSGGTSSAPIEAQ